MTSLRTFLSALCFSFVALLFGSSANASTVQLPQTSYTVNEDAGRVDIAVSVTRNTSLGANEVIQVDYTTMDGSARGGIDYTPTSGTLTFTAGVSSLAVSVPIINRPGDNGYATGSADFTFKISSPRSNAGAQQPTIAGSDTATVTIIDVDGNKVGFTSTDYPVDEPAAGGARTVRLVVKRYGQPNQPPAVVHYQTEDGSARSGTDYFARSGDLQFNDSQTTQFVDITVLNDSAAAGNKIFFVRLTPVSGSPTFGNSVATVTIVDQETSTVRLSSANYSVSETAGKVTVSIVRNGNLNVTGTVNLITSDGTAQAGRNYTATSRDVTFAAGQSSQNVDIPILNDSAVTGTLYFTASLSVRSGTNLLPGQPSTARISIMDVAPTNTVEFADPDQGVARGTGPAKIIVRLNRAAGNNEPVTVQFSTSNTTDPQQTAVPNVDYTPVSGTLTFNPGETIKLFEVPILDNAQTNDTRRLVLNLTNPSPNAFLGVSTALLSILPANSAGTIQFSAPVYSVYENNGSVTLTVLLDRRGDTSRTVTVDYATSPGTAGSSRFNPTSGRLTFANGASVATISVGIINDSVVQPDPQSFTVALSNPQNGSLGTPSIARVDILDDDGINTVEFAAAEYGVVAAVDADPGVAPPAPPVAILNVLARRGGDPNQSLDVDIDLGQPGDSATPDVDYSRTNANPPFPMRLHFAPG
ncbi:MAG: hypothetical protein M3Z22_00030, partial [Verrucomicrobiota bacterium]|nr:hypothetical protein [Verrucomicrobiota bacterium]